MSDGRAPRPVADVPPPALAGGEAVAKAWLLELLAGAPLADAAAVPVDELAAEGPALCAALLAAVGAQDGLDRLRPRGDRAGLAASAARLAGARDAAAAARAVAALRRALWAALRAGAEPPEALERVAVPEGAVDREAVGEVLAPAGTEVVPGVVAEAEPTPAEPAVAPASDEEAS
jgi:hypothetical protein